MTDPIATIQLGDCREIIAELPDCSVDAIVTDPPYEIGFMGKGWDAAGIAYDVELWRQCLRVLKPGGHLLAFGGTRTYHRMAAAIEDAGFEIRDSIHWLYGTGFPKSLDVSKAIDKQRDDRADIYKVTAWVKAARDAAGIGNKDIDDAFDANGMGRHWTDVPPGGKQPAVPTLEQVPQLLEVLGVKVEDVPDDIRLLLWDLNGKKGQPGENWAKREVVGVKKSSLGGTVAAGERDPEFINKHKGLEFDITTPATDAAVQWEGWGTALKPAHEPIVVARKPLSGTVAATVLEHGTGALNIDGCRIATEDTLGRASGGWLSGGYVGGESPKWNSLGTTVEGGRWPANLVLTHHADCGDQCATGCPVAELNEQSGDTGGASRFFAVTEWDPLADVAPFQYVAKPSKRERNAGLDGLEERPAPKFDGGSLINPSTGHDSTKVTARNFHPTVKPIALMRWLVRLVTPPGGTVLEPFAGSGTTMAAAILEDFHVIGCELTADYLPIIKGRIAWAHQERAATPPTLFDPTE